jgi:hypothetical protein
MNSNKSARACWHRSLPVLPAIGVFIFIVAAGAGLLALSSCATTPAGLQREQTAFSAATNIVHVAEQVAPAIPPPERALVELLLGVATAALAAWNTHLHRRLGQLNGNGSALAPPPPATPPPVL